MKPYAQFCPLASALDVIGDRWTLLIVRELLFLGPRRFTDLAAGLPGIAPNLLTARLRSLEAAALVERVDLPPPAASTVYRLTPDGDALREPVVALMQWGVRRMFPLGEDATVRPELLLMAVQAGFDVDAARGIDKTYEVVLDELVVSLQVDDGILHVAHGPAESPVLRIVMSLHTFARVVNAQIGPIQAVVDGDITLDGDAYEAELFLRIFGRIRTGQSA